MQDLEIYITVKLPEVKVDKDYVNALIVDNNYKSAYSNKIMHYLHNFSAPCYKKVKQCPI